jgi:hypothetical protein
VKIREICGEIYPIFVIDYAGSPIPQESKQGNKAMFKFHAPLRSALNGSFADFICEN